MRRRWTRHDYTALPTIPRNLPRTRRNRALKGHVWRGERVGTMKRVCCSLLTTAACGCETTLHRACVHAPISAGSPSRLHFVVRFHLFVHSSAAAAAGMASV